MSVLLVAEVATAAEPEEVWSVLTDWAGQQRWIPLTAVRVDGRQTGLGTAAEALTGWQLGRLPIGLLDRFVVTGWRPPTGQRAGELEVLHLGPQFRGVGVFRVRPEGSGSLIRCSELFGVPFGRLGELAGRSLLPVLRRGLQRSLGQLAEVCEAADLSSGTHSIDRLTNL